MNDMLNYLALLTLKHFIVDALLQTKYQYSNKGTFLHLGGILHATLHGVGTALCFYDLHIEIILILGIIDTLLHYIIDYTKVNITKKFQWSEYIQDDEIPYLKITSNNFFIAIVFDQCLHFLTYIYLIYLGVIS